MKTTRHTALAVFAIGALTSLVGDACHVLSGTTTYTWPGVPQIGCSALWFPLLVGLSMLGVAHGGRNAGLPSVPRTRAHVVTGVAAVLAFYAFTATLRGQPATVAVVLTGSIGVVFWRVWDPSRACFMLAAASAVVGPLAEIGFVNAGAVRYASDSCGLWGVAPWLPCLYFGACAVASGLWRALAADSSDELAER